MRLKKELSVLSALRKAGSDVRQDNAGVAEIVETVSSTYRYRLVPHLLRRTAEDPDGDYIPHLGTMGENLPAVLYQLSEHRPEAFDAISSRAEEAVSGFKGFEFASDPGNASGIRLGVRFADSRDVVDVNYVSDGTMTILGLATLVGDPFPPRLVLLEEPEMGLSPSATRLTTQWLLEYSAKVQTIVATHSPYFVAELYNSQDELRRRPDIRVLSLDSDASVSIQPLQEAIEQLKGQYAAELDQPVDSIASLIEQAQDLGESN
jgi:hypothetical protein